MTAREVLAGFNKLQRAYPSGKKYQVEDLQTVWPELLSCSSVAFDRAVGSIVKGSRFLPQPDYVLQRTLQMQRAVGQRVAPDFDSADPAYKSMNLVQMRLRGSLSDRDYIEELFAMSELHRLVTYAVEARRAEKQLEV